jgi:urease accessory protein
LPVRNGDDSPIPPSLLYGMASGRNFPTFVNIVQPSLARRDSGGKRSWYQLESRAVRTMRTTSRAAGTAYLTFTRSGAETVLTRAFATSPAKLIATRGRAPTCWVYSATLGGGLVGGDNIQLHVDVASGARALLTTQASTKVYRSRRRSRQVVTAAVDADALLAVVPDPIVCFADADFVQTQRYDLHARASLVMIDWLTSGRHGAGERWAFSRYESRFDIRRNSQRIFFDAIVLEPNLDCVVDRMGRFDVLMTAVISGPLVAVAAADIVERLSQTQIAPDRDLVVSATALRDGGALMRMAGASVEQVGDALRGYLAFLSPLIGDDLWSRKW